MGCARLMRTWHLSGADYARRRDGGYGLDHDGHWNDRRRPIACCATGPALCVLEKLAHIEDAALLPDDTVLVRYDVPARMSCTTSATSCLVSCRNSITDGVNIRGAGEEPSFRLRKAVEGVTELVPAPLLEVRSVLLSEFMQVFLSSIAHQHVPEAERGGRGCPRGRGLSAALQRPHSCPQ